jgi:hypothetical protein
MPITDSGGTSEMAIATPGRASETSGRESPYAPAAPAAPAAVAVMRSTTVGVERLTIWLFVVGSKVAGAILVSR